MKNTENAKEIGKGKLMIMAILRFLPLIMIIGIVLFITAGTMTYWNGWLFMGLILLPMISIFIYLLIKDPELLKKRLSSNEKEKTQKWVILISLILMLIAFILPGIDFRYNWSRIPLIIIIIASILFLFGYILFFIVLRQNSYASRVVEMQDKQKLIDTGLYSLVRHPMYLSIIIIYITIPLILGSFYALIPMLLYPIILNIRINNEEKMLEEGLDGYKEYKKKVKFKVIPYIW